MSGTLEDFEDSTTPVTDCVAPDGTTVKVGDKVLYRNSEGREQVGWVCAVPTTSGHEQSDPGTAHLFTVSPHSGPYVKPNVQPAAEGPETFSLLPGN